MANTGTKQLADYARAIEIEELQRRLVNWHDTKHTMAVRFDEAVHKLAQATLIECMAYAQGRRS